MQEQEAANRNALEHMRSGEIALIETYLLHKLGWSREDEEREEQTANGSGCPYPIYLLKKYNEAMSSHLLLQDVLDEIFNR